MLYKIISLPQYREGEFSSKDLAILFSEQRTSSTALSALKRNSHLFIPHVAEEVKFTYYTLNPVAITLLQKVRELSENLVRQNYLAGTAEELAVIY